VSTEPVRVMIVDAHEELASSLAQALDADPGLCVAGRARTLEEAATMIHDVAPDVLLLDHRLPDGDGVAAIPGLRAMRPSMAVVVLTATTAEDVLVDAIEAGATGFLSKSRGLPELTAAVRAAAAGEAVVSSEMLSRLLPRLRRHRLRAGGHAALTEREREVLALVAEGLTNAAIAERLVVSVHTVRNHVANLSAKLGASSKLEALSIAVREGLLPDA